MRQTHPAEYNLQKSAGVPKKSRWTDEERTVLALKEIEATAQGINSGMDKHLDSVFLGRTLDAIKGQRRQPAYKLIWQREVARSCILHTEAVQQIPVITTNVPEQKPQIQDAISNDQTEPPRPNVSEALVKEIQASIIKMRAKRTTVAKRLAKAAKVFLRSTNNRPYRVMDWLNQVFDRILDGPGSSGNGRQTMFRTLNTSKKRKKQEYSYIQALFKRGSKRAADYILNPVRVGDSQAPTHTEMFDFWEKIYKGKGHHEHAVLEEDPSRSSEAANRIWAPISVDEIKASELHYKSSPGPDYVTVKQWRSLPRDLRCLFYNILMAEGRIAPELLRARTVFIPKTDNPDAPGSYRPIGITSVIIRQYHRILARRLRAYHGFDRRQKANCSADGTAENLILLKAVMEDAHHKRRELHMVSIDIKKAFDSVTHVSVLETFRDLGCPVPFVNYVQSVYDQASTYLQYKGQSRKVRVLTGVLQGDPLSPIGFNYLMDGPIKALSESIGYDLQGESINGIVYADDIVLISKTKVGMQQNLDTLTNQLGRLGLEVNVSKSYALSMIPDGKAKKQCMPIDLSFSINGEYLRQIGPNDTWKYLGISFTGIQVQGIKPNLITDLARIGSAPIKPQQKCLVLRNHLLTKYQHMMVLGRVNRTALEMLDGVVRKMVKSWLHLRPDVPDVYLYAKTEHGGLSLPHLALDIPRMRLERMEKFIKKGCPVAQAVEKTRFYQIAQQDDVSLLETTVEGVGKEEVNKYWETKLDEAIDTKGLAQSKHCSQSSSFIWSNAHRITGRDYVHFHQLRSGCLPTRARRLRGCDGDRTCRHGCGTSETNYHVIQGCHRTKGGRILRHNRVLQLLITDLEQQDRFSLFKEQRFKTDSGLKIPDLILADDRCAVLIDVQIVDSEDMDERRKQKIDKYQGVHGLAVHIKGRYNCKDVVFETLTMSYKGVFERRSAELMRKLRISRETQYRISTSVLLGSWLNWFCFNKQYFVPVAA